jgi:hypothetical protein
MVGCAIETTGTGDINEHLLHQRQTQNFMWTKTYNPFFFFFVDGGNKKRRTEVAFLRNQFLKDPIVGARLVCTLTEERNA